MPSSGSADGQVPAGRTDGQPWETRRLLFSGSCPDTEERAPPCPPARRLGGGRRCCCGSAGGGRVPPPRTRARVTQEAVYFSATTRFLFLASSARKRKLGAGRVRARGRAVCHRVPDVSATPPRVPTRTSTCAPDGLTPCSPGSPHPSASHTAPHGFLPGPVPSRVFSTSADRWQPVLQDCRHWRRCLKKKKRGFFFFYYCGEIHTTQNEPFPSERRRGI